MILSYIIILLLMMNISSALFLAFLGDSFGFFDDLAVVTTFIIQGFIIIFLIGENKIKFPKTLIRPTIIYTIFILINLLNSIFLKFYLFDVKSFSYELYKLSIFFFMIPFAFLDSKILLSVVKKLIGILSILLSINLIFTIAQYIWEPDILTKIGVKGESFTTTFSLDHKTGLFPGKNISGAVNLLGLILSLIYSTNKDIFIKYKIIISNLSLRVLQIISVFGIILSESKNIFLSFIILLFIYLKIKNLYKITLIGSAIITIFISMYYFNIFSLKDKAEGYFKLIENYDFLMKNIDLAGGFIEFRAVSLLKGILTISSNFPFGTGLGTWGDSSSLLNHNVNRYLEFNSSASDSYLVHIFVEQGVIFTLYLYIVYLITNNHKQIGKALFITFLIYITATMGSSVAIIPLLMSFIFSILVCISKEREKIISYK